VDHQLGQIDLIRWQGRRNRRLKTSVSGWTLVLGACALVGLGTLAAQAAGALPWSGPLAAAPAALVLLALSAYIVAVFRAVLSWITG